jgi:hypothetical protein
MYKYLMETLAAFEKNTFLVCADITRAELA